MEARRGKEGRCWNGSAATEGSDETSLSAAKGTQSVLARTEEMWQDSR